MVYSERLKTLKLWSLDDRRKRGLDRGVQNVTRLIISWLQQVLYTLDKSSCNNNNNNNSRDNVYGAVIMTKVIARVHPVHLMNVDWASGGRQPSGQASRLGLWVRRKLAAIIHIHHRHCYYYSAHNLILIYRPTKGRLSWPKHCSKSAQPVLKTVYRSSCRIKHNCQRRDSNLGPLTPQSDALTTRLLRPAYLWT